MDVIKFRRPILIDDVFDHFSYWGVKIQGSNFVGPESGTEHRQDEQFTGMRDKNGTDIYEGDIIRSRVNLFFKDMGYQERAVTFENGTFVCPTTSLKTVMFFEPKVIGNIHE